MKSKKGEVMPEKEELIEKLCVDVATVCELYHGFNQDMSRFMIEILRDLKDLREMEGIEDPAARDEKGE